jgi:hypothetical protein
MKPKIKIQKKIIYPKLTLDPEYHKRTRDKCEITFKEKYIEIHALVDNTGNVFHLPYESIKGVCYR